MAHIYLRNKKEIDEANKLGKTPPKKVYTVRFKGPDDKWHEYAGGPTKRIAQKRLQEIFADIEEGRFKSSKNPLFSTYVDVFLSSLKQKNLSESTIDEYKRAIKKYLDPHFGKMRLQDITAYRIQIFMNKLSKIKIETADETANKADKFLAPATQAKIFRYLKAMLRQAVPWGLIPRDPTQGVKGPKLPPASIDFFTVEECWQLLDGTSSKDKKALYATAAFGGLRIGEIAALRWKNIDFEKGVISVVASYSPEYGMSSPKSQLSKRLVPICLPLKDILLEHYNASNQPDANEFVFKNQRGGQIDRRNILRKHFLPTLDRVGLRHIKFHELRHTFASLCIDCNVNPRVLQEVMGHEDIKTTLNTYGHLYPTSREELARKLSGLLLSREDEEE